MKKLNFILFLLPIISFGQSWSNYYIDANINKNVNVSGTVNKNVKVTNRQTITTIDYGQLALANAQKEKNRLENLQYSDARAQRVALEIAANPLKAFDYGRKSVSETKTNKKSGEGFKYTGFKKFSLSYTVPHSAIFSQAGAGRFENVSDEGITTAFMINAPLYNYREYPIWTENNSYEYEKLDDKGKKKFAKENPNWFANDPELDAKMKQMKVGEINAGSEDSIFVHKKDVNRATVWGTKGYVGTLIWEDEYQYCITDNYSSISPKDNGIKNFVKVRYYGDKDEITFEQLEGRRYYLKRLVEKVIATAFIFDTKYQK